ncbi:MAG: hypothetical protein KBD78_01655 [Oligoflexales bacterium]|nr:hypothetical protein [Oligoflexales bacterium]
MIRRFFEKCLKQKILLGLVFLMNISCVKNVEEGIELKPSVKEDKPYYESYVLHTRQKVVIKDFEKKFSVVATYMSKNFVTSLMERYKNLFKVNETPLEDVNGKLAFFVSFSTPDREYVDMANKKLWRVFSTIDGNNIEPVVLKKIKEKERWQAFYPEITPWSHEYLVIFDHLVPATAGDSADNLGVEFLLAGTEAEIKMLW